ncbi:MAG: N-acyl homoserine lactonase family protein [Hyphomicrobiaceae bacterium]
MSETYEILSVKYGGVTERKRAENFLHPLPDDHASPMPIDYFVFVIRNDKRTILVDTGFDHKEAKARGRKITAEPVEVLEKIGIKAADIKDTVITHLHFDHAGTMHHFPNCKFHLQEAEMAYATGKCMCEASMKVPFSLDHVCEMVKNVYSGRVHFHDGDGQIAPGITVHKSPGHSQGIQALRVNTANGPVVLASDVVHFYENIENRRPFYITIDMAATLKSYDRLIELAGGLRNVIPGHDPLIMKRYPAWKPDTEGLVHKLDAPRLD